MPQPVSNPPNPWHSQHVEWLDGAPSAELHVYEEDARSILSRNDSPDLPFRYSVNPYRGCYHGCAYCYARPSHQYLDWGAGTDFERRIVVKRNAPELLRKELAKASWQRTAIAFSGNTDCYQPLEASYALTRACLTACVDAKNPATIITKGALVRRDIDVLQSLRDVASAHVFVSIPFASEDDARKVEPYASPIRKRFEAIRALADAGIPTGIAIAPVIPGLTDSAIPELLQRASDAGATRAFMILLRLAPEVRTIFEARIDAVFEHRADKIKHALTEMRSGNVSDNRFGSRMVGHGPRWQLIESMFESNARRLGLETGERTPTELLDTHDSDHATANTPSNRATTLLTIRKKPRNDDQLGFDFKR